MRITKMGITRMMIKSETTGAKIHQRKASWFRRSAWREPPRRRAGALTGAPAPTATVEVEPTPSGEDIVPPSAYEGWRLLRQETVVGQDAVRLLGHFADHLGNPLRVVLQIGPLEGGHDPLGHPVVDLGDGGHVLIVVHSVAGQIRGLDELLE